MKMKTKSPTKLRSAKSKWGLPKAPAGHQANLAKPSEKATNHRPSSHHKPTKIQRCLDLLTRRDGATIEELMAATGWQTHSVRGFLAGTVKKKLGLTLDSAKVENGARHYRVITAEAGAQ